MRASNRGFSLIELMITLAVAAILIGLAAPSFRQFLVNTQLENGVAKLVGSINLARTAAVTRNRSVSLVRAGADWADGWCVAEGTPADCSGTVLRRIEGMDGSIGLVTTTAFAAIEFTNQGFLPLQAGALAADRVFQICAASGSEGFEVRIGNTGRPAWARIVCP